MPVQPTTCRMPQASIYIIVPAYNEATIIRKTVQNLLQTGYQVILVDDASHDQTAANVRDLPIHYLRHPLNLGQGAALMTGMRYARTQGADAVVHFDADGQHQAHDIDRMLSALQAGKKDVVLGSRFLSPESRKAIPLMRRMLLRLAILFNGMVTGLWLTDAHNGLRALNAKALHRIELRENGMAHATEILMEFRKHQLSIEELPVDIRYTDYSQQKGQSSWNALHIISDILIRKLLP